MRERRDHYRALFLSVFHHRDDVLDPALLDREAQQFDPTLFLHALVNLPMSTLLSAPFRQRGSKRSLAHLLQPAVEYAAALQTYTGTDEDRTHWTLLEHTLQHALEHTDDLDLVCRHLERLTHQAGWTVPSPPSSHTWRAPEWRTLLASSEAARTSLEHAPPLTQSTVARTWRERLEAVEPITWMQAVLAFHDTLLKIHIQRHPSPRPRPRVIRGEGLIEVTALQALAERLTAAEQVLQRLPPPLAQQITTAVLQWRQQHPDLIQDVLRQHGLNEPDEIAGRSRDDSLPLLGDLLATTARVSSAPDPAP